MPHIFDNMPHIFGTMTHIFSTMPLIFSTMPGRPWLVPFRPLLNIISDRVNFRKEFPAKVTDKEKKELKQDKFYFHH